MRERGGMVVAEDSTRYADCEPTACAERVATVKVAEELLEYLDHHPRAADTLDGIMSWWLPRQRYETERRKVEEALDSLVTEGALARYRLIDGTVVYARHETNGAKPGNAC